MHPRAAAERRAKAERRLDASLIALADRSGIQRPPTVAHRDAAVRDLLRLEALADIAERLSGVSPIEPVEPEPEAVSGEELYERLTGLDGVGEKTATDIIERLNQAGLVCVLASSQAEGA